MREDSFAAALDLRPAVMQFAWARPDQDLKPYFARAHDAGCKITHMAGAVPEAVRAAEAGADIIIAQGTEGGGHVGWMASIPLVPMIVDAVAPIPVLAAGGFANGRGLVARSRSAPTASCSARGSRHRRVAAASELQAGDRRQRRARHAALGDSRHRGRPGVARRDDPIAPQRLHRAWAGREWALRQNRAEAHAKPQAARKSGDVAEGPLSMGQDAGLIHDIVPAADIVTRIAREAEEILRRKLPALVA